MRSMEEFLLGLIREQSAIDAEFYNALRSSLKHGDGKIPEVEYREWLSERDRIDWVLEKLEVEDAT